MSPYVLIEPKHFLGLRDTKTKWLYDAIYNWCEHMQCLGDPIYLKILCIHHTIKAYTSFCIVIVLLSYNRDVVSKCNAIDIQKDVC